MNKKTIYTRTCAYFIEYHVAWSVKHRKEVITEEIKEELSQMADEIAADKGFEITYFEAEKDHIRCSVSAPPKLSVSYIVKMLKGILGRKLLERHPEIREQLWKGELWNHNYYVETTGSISEDEIQKYMERQKSSY